MPPSCCSTDYDAVFSDRQARRDLAGYLRNGTSGTTKRIVDTIAEQGVEGATLLDIGGGVGAIQHELLAAGAARAIDIDFSRPYLAVAREEAERRGLAGRITFRYGDFVALAGEIEAADIVTLDRVVCCYPDMTALVRSSAERARSTYALAYPIDRWWLRAGAAIGNGLLAAFRHSYRMYVHPTRAVDSLVRSLGFERAYHHRGWAWQTAIYRRVR